MPSLSQGRNAVSSFIPVARRWSSRIATSQAMLGYRHMARLPVRDSLLVGCGWHWRAPRNACIC